ncbi:optic atrophy 3 protein homolog [Anastrepha ludens]|uniref:optic atrophy 3 protein homolog n=1 Tax=Anastrepha ludens TaxID=28586 RepID=UPI0023AF8EA0|nr:optic atrophy 3 protein homolog [Anastrepha ludens]
MALVTLRIFRMAIIVFKEFTQPVKRLFVNIAQHNDFFRNYICKPPAYGYRWCEHSLLMLLSKETSKTNKPLAEEEAIILGSAIWAEVVVFICCSEVVLMESKRQAKKEEEEERLITNRVKDLHEAMRVLQHRLHEQYFYIEQIIEALKKLGMPIERRQVNQRAHATDKSFVQKLV